MSGSEHKNQEREDAREAASWLRQYAQVGEFLGLLAVLGYVGYRLDQRYGWEPWGLLGGLLLGMVIGLYRMSRGSRH